MVPEQGDDGMGMQIASNVIAISTLNGLEKNRKKQSKALNQATSGTRINYAGDDASGYAISERMRVQIRSLNQDVENVKTGKDLLHTAEGGVQSIVNELRNLKAMALDSANDTNTDVDRATIQKEFSSRMEEINDIAATTNYNGKILLDGRYGNTNINSNDSSSTALLMVGKTGILSDYIISQNKNVQKTILPCNAISETIIYDPNEPLIYNSKIGGLFPKGGLYTDVSLGGIAGYSPPFRGSGGSTHEKIDFSNVTGNLPTDLDNQGFTIYCTDCYQDVTVKFDAEREQGTGKVVVGKAYRPSTKHLGENEEVNCYAFVIGVKGVSSGKELEDAVFSGISSVRSSSTDEYGNTFTQMIAYHNLGITKSGSDYYLTKSEFRMVIAEGFEGKLTGGSTPATGGEFTPIDPGGGTTPVDPGGGTGPVPSGGGEAGDVITDNAQMEAGSLIIHTGTKANQHLRLFLNDMHTSAMGLDDAGVDPLERALKSIGMLDTAIDYALNESTRVGAYISRLDATQDNLTTAHENVTHAESVIRDADMAKTMTEYAKDDILSQAAQAMLAQANQQGHAVLNLLQG